MLESGEQADTVDSMASEHAREEDYAFDTRTHCLRADGAIWAMVDVSRHRGGV